MSYLKLVISQTRTNAFLLMVAVSGIVITPWALTSVPARAAINWLMTSTSVKVSWGACGISRAKTKFRSDWDACGYMTLRRSIISIGVPVDTSSKDAV